MSTPENPEPSPAPQAAEVGAEDEDALSLSRALEARDAGQEDERKRLSRTVTRVLLGVVAGGILLALALPGSRAEIVGIYRLFRDGEGTPTITPQDGPPAGGVSRPPIDSPLVREVLDFIRPRGDKGGSGP